MYLSKGDQSYRLTEVGPPIHYNASRPTIALLNANPFAEGIANLGAQAIAQALIDAEYNVEFAFADTPTSGQPFIGNFVTPADCSVFAVSIPFEDTYHHVVRLLRFCGIEPLGSERDNSDPIVVAGGLSLINPMPLSPFFDAMVIGEGREAIVTVADMVTHARSRGAGRSDILDLLAAIPHVFVPSRYCISYDAAGVIADFRPLGGAPSSIKVARPLDMSKHPLVSTWTSPRACYKYDDYFSLMVAMGCHKKCPFCVVGLVQGDEGGKALNINLEQVLRLSQERREKYGTNLVKLFFASSFSRESAIDSLDLKDLLRAMLELGFHSRVGSLNVRQADEELLLLVKQSGQCRVTFAPEASESLRVSVGKSYSKDEKITSIARMAASVGMGLDLYTMIGLPEEKPHHISDLAGLVRECAHATNPGQALEVSINPCFAKAQTPYERYATVRPEVARHRFRYLRSCLSDVRDIRWVSVIEDAMCYYQPILALGGPELATVLLDMSSRYLPTEDDWRSSVWRNVGDDSRYFRERPEDERLPWQHIIYNDHDQMAVRLKVHRSKAARA